MFDYHRLSHAQFESLVVSICKKLLGQGTKGFAAGPDGGCDAKFVGKAERFPSEARQWDGTIIIQAKHTSAYKSSFSDSNFWSPKSKSSIIAKEIPRILNMYQSKKLDYYMVFANRHLTRLANEKIGECIAQATGIEHDKICLVGLDDLDQWLSEFPEIAKQKGLQPASYPVNFDAQDLAEVIEALADQDLNSLNSVPSKPIQRIDYASKNQYNGLSANFAQVWRKIHLKQTDQIAAFLQAPINDNLKDLYQNIAESYKLKIEVERPNYPQFEKLIDHIEETLVGRSPVLKRHPRLTRLMLFYMYWNCDIGVEEDVTAN